MFIVALFTVAKTCMCTCSVTQSYPAICKIFLARILKWFAISSSRSSSQPRDQICISCIGRRILLLLSHLEAKPRHGSNKCWIKKMWGVCVCVCEMEYYSGIKKEWNSTFYSNMDGPRVLSEVSQRKTNTIWYHLRVESKIWPKWTYLQNRNRLTENRLVVAKVEGVRDRLEFWGYQM